MKNFKKIILITTLTGFIVPSFALGIQCPTVDQVKSLAGRYTNNDNQCNEDNECELITDDKIFDGQVWNATIEGIESNNTAEAKKLADAALKNVDAAFSDKPIWSGFFGYGYCVYRTSTPDVRIYVNNIF